MKKKMVLIYMLVILGVAALAAGLSFFFIGNADIAAVPNFLQVSSVDGNFFLTCQYDANYHYQFLIEKEDNGTFLQVVTANSETNTLDLSSQNINPVMGQQYRFSARYIKENGSGNAKFCSSVTWLASTTLSKVEGVKFDSKTQILSWSKTNLADFYTVKIVDINGTAQSFDSQTTLLDIGDLVQNPLALGSYKAYVFANSQNENILQSSASEAINFDLNETNAITSCTRAADNNLTIVCSQNVTQFQINSGDTVLAFVTCQGVNDGSGYVYELKNVSAFLDGVDFENDDIKIKSLAEDYIFESEFFTIV